MNLLDLVPLEWKAAIGLAALAVLGYLANHAIGFIKDRAGDWFRNVTAAVGTINEIAAGQSQLQAELGRVQEYVCDRVEGVHREVMVRIELSDAKTSGTVGLLTNRVAAIELKVDAIEQRLNGAGRPADRRRVAASPEVEGS